METHGWCEADSCHQPAISRCTRCGQALCAAHTVVDYRHLPGGQRPYCAECDRERRDVYAQARRQGARVTAWSAFGAIVGAIVGYGAGILLTPDSFTHTVTTDAGFLVGLAVALSVALATSRPASSEALAGRSAAPQAASPTESGRIDSPHS